MIMAGISISDGKESGEKVMADSVYVTPEYFATLQMPILFGRSFTQADGEKSQHVAIVNQTFVRKYFHGANALGRHLNKDTEIVGVVADVGWRRESTRLRLLPARRRCTFLPHRL